MDSERRKYQRFRVEGAANINMADGRPYIFARVMDFSASGCYIETMYPLPVGTELKLKISLKAPEIVFDTTATVRTSDQGVGMGVKFGDECSERLEKVQQELEKQAAG